MIKLILKGGLGNQMFQYAAAYSASKSLNFELRLDTSYLDTRIPIPGFTFRNYELHFYEIPETPTSLFKNALLNKYFSYAVLKALIVSKLVPSFVEKDVYNFDPSFFNVTANSYIEGFFNNFKYFDKYREDIKQLFHPDKLINSDFSEIEQSIANSNSVSISIRRGDYLNNKHKDVFIFLDEDYYKKAIEVIKSKVKNPHFYIFSVDFPEGDDSYFVNNLGLNKNEFTMLGKKYVGEKFKTYLRLISLCKHNIIANSTFSFWGAYLNVNQNNLVVCPSKWTHNWSDFECPEEWISL